MNLAKEILLMTKDITTILSMIFTTYFAFSTYQNSKKAPRKKTSKRLKKFRCYHDLKEKTQNPY